MAARYYQAVTGKKEAARAHVLRKKLEAKKSRKESEVHEDCEELMKIEESESEESAVGNEEPELHESEKKVMKRKR